MRRFIFGERNGIYIIDLEQTLTRVETAYNFVRELSAKGGSVMFIGTKKQAQDPVRSYADKTGMPYVNERWLGGMLTNFETIAKRVAKMLEYERMRTSGEFDAMPKKEALLLTRELEKLQKNLGGIRSMNKRPDAVFILDTKKEHIAVTEANKLGHPDHRGRRHQRRSRHHPVPDPRQRRRDPRERADGASHRGGDRGGPLHLAEAQPAGAAEAAFRRGGGRVRGDAGRGTPPGCRCAGRARLPARNLPRRTVRSRSTRPTTSPTRPASTPRRRLPPERRPMRSSPPIRHPASGVSEADVVDVEPGSGGESRVTKKAEEINMNDTAATPNAETGA
jgi:hypothetical protein